LARHLRPTPRVLQGQALRDLASAAIDISDGLISDLKHVLKASNCGARIELNELPISQSMAGNVSPEQALRWALSGGEDYELCFTIPEINRGTLETALSHLGADYTCIGQVGPPSEGMKFYRDNQEIELSWHGYDHFHTEQTS
jgi:thiamine-monophosphate kinase